MADQNHKLALLQILAGSGDRLLQLGIFLVVVVSGGGNFIKTSNVAHTTEVNHADIQKAIDEIHRIDSIIDEAMTRQKAINESVDQVLKELKEQKKQ